MKKNGIGIRKAVTLTAAAAAAAAMLLAGCGNGAGKLAAEETTQAAVSVAETGTLLLSVNPEMCGSPGRAGEGNPRGRIFHGRH